MKKIIYSILIIACLLIGYRICYPVKIIGIHHTSESIIVLVVEHFPWTTQGKIRWWENNREKIFRPLHFNKKIYTVYIFNTHYKKDSGTDEDSDLNCFEEMDTAENCVSKENHPLIVRHYRDGHIEYQTESIWRRFY